MQILGIKPGPQMKSIMEFTKELKDENPNITKDEAAKILIDKFKPNIVQACNEPESTCPKHLLKTKVKNINDCFNNKKYYEVLTISNELKDQYGNDDEVARILAKAMFKLLLIDEKFKQNDLVQYIFNKSQINFFDYSLCSYCLGILLLIKTRTEENIIKEIYNRVKEMSPNDINKIMNLLPENIYNKKLREELNENN